MREKDLFHVNQLKLKIEISIIPIIVIKDKSWIYTWYIMKDSPEGWLFNLLPICPQLQSFNLREIYLETFKTLHVFVDFTFLFILLFFFSLLIRCGTKEILHLTKLKVISLTYNLQELQKYLSKSLCELVLFVIVINKNKKQKQKQKQKNRTKKKKRGGERRNVSKSFPCSLSHINFERICGFLKLANNSKG